MKVDFAKSSWFLWLGLPVALCILWCSEHKRPIMVALYILWCPAYKRTIMVSPCILRCSEYIRPIMVILWCYEYICPIMIAPCIVLCSVHVTLMLRAYTSNYGCFVHTLMFRVYVNDPSMLFLIRRVYASINGCSVHTLMLRVYSLIMAAPCILWCSVYILPIMVARWNH